VFIINSDRIFKITIRCDKHGNVTVRTYRLKTFSIYEYNDWNQKNKRVCIFCFDDQQLPILSKSEGANSSRAPLTCDPRSNMLVVFLVQISSNERTVQRPHASRLAWSSRSKFRINLVRNKHRDEGWETGQELALKPSEMDIIRHASSSGPACCNTQNCHFRRKSPQ
jgi:hypothetical protein